MLRFFLSYDHKTTLKRRFGYENAKILSYNARRYYGRHYEGCSNMNASSFITFFTYILRQNGIHF